MPDSTLDAHLKEQEASSDLSITELGLPTRAKNALLEAGINTVDEALAALAEGDQALTDIRGFGPKSLAALKEKLQERGFLSPQDDAIPAPLRDLETTLEKEWQELEELELEMDRVAAVELAAEEEPQMEAAVPAPADVRAATEAKAKAEAEKRAPAPSMSAMPAAGVMGEPLTLGQRLGATLDQAREQLRFGGWVYASFGLLLVVIAFLLVRRLSSSGYVTLDAANNSVSHPDGLTLSVDAETFTERLRVRLSAVPRLELLEGSAGNALRQAVEALPGHLTVKSPLYQIKTSDNPDQPVMIDVLVPNDAEPWETLDLYTWTGETWEWVGSDLHTEVAEHEFVRAQVTTLPSNLVVVQAGPITPTVSASLGADDNPTAAAGVVDEFNPTGLLLGVNGDFVGEPNGLPQPGTSTGEAVLPTLRNWAPDGTVNRGLLSDVLKIPEIREAHIANIVQLCIDNGYAGVDVDYRGIEPEDRDAYSDFIAALAKALHAQGLRLTVAVEPPISTNGGWDTGGYDWARLGAAADAVKVPFPQDPAAYVEDGEAERLLDWATAQMSRYKVRMLISSLSADRSEQGIKTISLDKALAPFGKVVAHDDVTQVEPGTRVSFGLSGRLLSITPYEAAGTYRLEYEAEDSTTHTIWLGTATSLVTKWQWAHRYNLGGIAVADMLDPGNAPGIVDAVAGYRTVAAPPGSDAMEVVWTVTNAATTVDQQVSPLTDPDYTWMVLATSGTYNVSAKIAGFDHGSVAVVVGQPEPAIAVTETITMPIATQVVTPTGEVDEECLDARYVADVTIPDDTQLENGEEFEKTWRVRNTGTCAWPEDTVLAFVKGSQMDAPDSVEVGAVEPGDEVEVTVKMTAPEEPNRYTGVWQMKTAEGFFGGNLSVVIRAGDVESIPVAPPPSGGGGFELGGHVRDTGLPYADKMHYAGMNWSKVQVHYGQDASGIIQVAHAKGFKIQLSALGRPDMVTQPGFEQDFANWVAGLAAAGADAIEVWNEPNIDREWQIGHISPQAYTKLLCTSYRAIKAANAGTAVISAAPAPTGSFGGVCQPNGGNCDDIPWLQGLVNAGATQCMDYIGAHHNAGATAPSARSGHPADQSGHHSWYFLPQTELYYNIFGGARKIFYTEMGYASQEGVPPFHDAFGWARGTNNAEQAAWLAEAVQLSINTGMVRCIIVWNIDFVRYGYDPQDGYAIIRPDGSCPACDALHNVLGTR